MWPTNVSVASQNFAEASFRHTHDSCHFSVRIALGRRSYNTHRHLLLQVTWHDTIKEWQKPQNDLARNTQYWVVNLLGRLHTKWQQLRWLSFQPVPILSGLTGIHHSFGEVMGCRNQHYRKTSNISRTSVGNKIVDNSDVVGASPVGAAPTTSSFST